MASEPLLPPRDDSVHPRMRFPDYRGSLLRAPGQPRIAITPTESELSGPRFPAGSIARDESDLLTNAGTGQLPAGPRIRVFGRVTGQDGRGIDGVVVEIWQANASGRYRHGEDRQIAPLDPNFLGCGRCVTDVRGHYAFRTVRPGPYPWPNGPNTWRPAHIHLSLLGPVLGSRLVTQMYFEGDPLLDLCPIFRSVADPRARSRLVAGLDLDQSEPFDHLAWRFDIVLRGTGVTPLEAS